jgi:DNA-binding CsgD family transcriptional regulator
MNARARVNRERGSLVPSGEDSNTTFEPVTFTTPEGTPTLKVIAGPWPGRVLRLEKAVTVLGKGSTADLRLRAHGVSREHAKLVLTHDGIVNLVDLDSTNGTFLNRSRIDVALVREGDRIQLGAHLTLAFSRRVLAPVDPDHPRLTPRQLEVARLVAVGSTNAETAKALDVATRTVASHLERIYDQLGIGSRAELAKWLVERGLHDEPAA